MCIERTILENSTQNSCRSNYWTANLYFKARNGSYKRVPQVPNRDLFNDKYTPGTKGGFVVYYVSPGKSKVTAFKPVGASAILLQRFSKPHP